MGCIKARLRGIIGTMNENGNLLLRTARLTLTPLDPLDLAWFLALNREPAVKRHLWDDERLSRDTAKQVLTDNHRLFAEHGYGLWKARHDADPIGYYGLWHFFDEAQAQLLYVTDPKQTRRGYAREAAGAVIAYAFTTLDYAYLDAAIDAGNEASCALALALGFRETRRDAVDGKPTLFFRRERQP